MHGHICIVCVCYFVEKYAKSCERTKNLKTNISIRIFSVTSTQHHVRCMT